MAKKNGSTKSSSSAPRSASTKRREEVRKNLVIERHSWLERLNRPSTYYAAAIALTFVTVITSIILWSRPQLRLQAGQVAWHTAVARVGFDMLDEEATENARNIARQQAPRVYRANEVLLNELEAALRGLPEAVAGRPRTEEVAPDIVLRFQLTDEAIKALAPFVDSEDRATPAWNAIVNEFLRDLLLNPLIDAERYQKERTEPNVPIQVWLENGRAFTVDRDDLLNVDSEQAKSRIRAVIMMRFPEPIRPNIEARVLGTLRPTAAYDEERTRQTRDRAAQNVPGIFARYDTHDLLFARGEVLTPMQVRLAQREADVYAATAPWYALWTPRLAVLGLVVLLTSAIGGYFFLFRPRLLDKASNLSVLAALLTGLLALTAASLNAVPGSLVFSTVGPVLLLAIILVVAYDQRFAIGLSAIYALFVCLAVTLPPGYYVLLLTAAGVMVWQLKETRDRNRLVNAGVITGSASAVAAIVVGAVYRPPTTDLGRLLLFDGLGGAAAGMLVGLFALGILSTIERLFNVTTGLTLVELRDSRQPLLRQLQQLAPGTYNHSLQVANLCESAAEEIGANSLLAYVGALYHDIGKMNKPAYFVENQGEGASKHLKLSPAMSLLIIVGHVKDGIEMAREFGLPKVLHHFIEAHHGTTLVEYFYHIAKERSETGQTLDQVSDTEYRYPGPKPRTKEVAILMIADAVESAARAMNEPTPARIEQLVRTIAKKRLEDGQFDHCDITLRELKQIENSLVRALGAIYHGRVAYPGGDKEREKDRDRTGTATATATGGPATASGAASTTAATPATGASPAKPPSAAARTGDPAPTGTGASAAASTSGGAAGRRPVTAGNGTTPREGAATPATPGVGANPAETKATPATPVKSPATPSAASPPVEGQMLEDVAEAAEIEAAAEQRRRLAARTSGR